MQYTESMKLKGGDNDHQIKPIFLDQDTLDAAIAYFQKEKGIELNPNCAETYNALGEYLVHQGNIMKAMLCFRRAVALNPNSAWYYQNLGNTATSGKIHSKAWEFYRRALELDSNVVQQWKQHFAPSFTPSEKALVSHPIFVVGCGHSGTTLMLAMLGTHSFLHPIPRESCVFFRLTAQIKSTLAIWDQECLASGSNRWVEKTPLHIHCIYKIWKYRPQSQLILMLRDGRDVVCSIKHRKDDYKTFEQCLDRWIYDNIAAFPYYDDPRLKIVKYEDLIAQPEAAMREILAFLGEPYDPEVLQFHQTEKYWYSSDIKKPEVLETGQDNLKLRNWQINQPLYDGRGRWRQEMTPEEKDLFKSYRQSKAQKQLERFGYVENDNW